MKKLSLLLFLATTTLFLSCSSDDDAPIVIDASLIPGEWNLTETRSENGKVTTTVQGIPVSGDYSISGKDYTASITLTESTVTDEPNTFSSSGGFTLVATVTIPGQDPTEVEEVVPDFFGSGEWTVSGNQITTTVQGEAIAYEITSLTAQEMTLKATLNEEQTFEGVTVTITGDQFIVLSK